MYTTCDFGFYKYRALQSQTRRRREVLQYDRYAGHANANGGSSSDVLEPVEYGSDAFTAVRTNPAVKSGAKQTMNKRRERTTCGISLCCSILRCMSLHKAAVTSSQRDHEMSPRYELVKKLSYYKSRFTSSSLHMTSYRPTSSELGVSSPLIDNI